MNRAMDLFLGSLRWILAGSSALFVCACYGNGVNPSPSQRLVNKRVTAEDSQLRPIPGLRVDIKSSSGTVASAVTDNTGMALCPVLNNLGEKLAVLVHDADGPANLGDFQDKTAAFLTDADEGLKVTMALKAAAGSAPAAAGTKPEHAPARN
jgi:hypothetical protein